MRRAGFGGRIGAVNPITSYTCKLTAEQAKALEWHLRENGFEGRTVPYAKFAGAKKDVNLVFYESGKLVVQGKGRRSSWSLCWSR